jgi:hypothetical protein
MKITTVFIVASLLGACAAVPQTEEEASKKAEIEGQMITANVPENYRQIVAERLRQILKDPDSVRDATISRPAVINVGLFSGNPWGAKGAVVCARLNATNSFGGYTGITSTGFWFREKLIAAISDSDHRYVCDDGPFAYFPFPELTAQSNPNQSAKPGRSASPRPPAKKT